MKKRNIFIYLALFAAAAAIATYGFQRLGTDALFIPMLVVLVYFTAFFIIAQVIKDNSIIDMGWGLGFVFGSWATLLITENPTLLSYVIVVFITIWGGRLSFRLIKRNWGKPEDFRYAQWRKDWGNKVVLVAFFRVFMLQGLINFIVGSASYVVIKYNEFSFLENTVYVVVAGIIIALIGLFFEIVGDEQLKRHIKRGSKTLMDQGLWSITRHPNYFGEILIWVGLYLTGASLIGTTLNIWYYLTLIISPILMSVVLLKISTPLLEKHMAKYDGWKAYTQKTPMVFPWGKKNK